MKKNQNNAQTGLSVLFIHTHFRQTVETSDWCRDRTSRMSGCRGQVRTLPLFSTAPTLQFNSFVFDVFAMAVIFELDVLDNHLNQIQ